MLSSVEAVEQVRLMVDWRDKEAVRLEQLHGYARGKHKTVWLAEDIPPDVRRLAAVAKVPVIGLVVDSIVQSLYVEAYRAPRGDVDVEAWRLWQANRLDSHQTGVHRAASEYGAAYTTVLPGDPVPVIAGASPRRMTAVYGDDRDWPVWALESRRTAKGKMWRLFDEEAVYWVGDESDTDQIQRLTFIESDEHGAGVVPVVRFLDTEDLDDEVRGEVEPLIPLQDQIDITTFGLLVAQHFGAFRQRYILGWMANSEEKRIASASKLWTFEDEDIKVGEFGQTNLDGYIESREATLRHLATVSQTPVNELTGMLVNLSAEALIAARDAHNRKLSERKIVRGEAWEQTLDLAGRYVGYETDPAAWVRWKNTDSHALSAVADGLGKLAEMLDIPKRALWDRAADAVGASQQELETWKQLADDDPVDRLAQILKSQSA